MKNIKPYIIILVIGMFVSLLLPKSQSVNQFGVSGITIPQGGTGMNSVPAGEVLIGYNQMRLQSTTTPTFTWMTTSSSTQSSIFAGKVGIGTTTPSSKLDINGYVKVLQTSTTTECTSVIKGSIFYNESNNIFWGCSNGNVWKPLSI